MPQLAVARFWFEGNSFTPVATGFEAFAQREWRSGADALTAVAGSAVELAAVPDFLADRPDWSATALRCASAAPGGPLDAEVFRRIVADIAGGLQGRRWDAVYLSLHGAAVVAGEPCPERRLIEAVRAVIGDTPLGASFDLHANLGAATLRLLDIASAYRTHPHVDMRATARRVLDLLAATASGRIRPVGALAKVPALLHSFHMRTEAGPMAEAMALARAVEAAPGMIEASLLGGFVWGDSPDAGAAAFAFADGDPARAKAAAEALAAALFARRHRFKVRLPDPAEGLRRARRAPPGLVALLDPADNPLSGGVLDTPAVLRAALAAKLDEPTVFAALCDPELVAAAAAAGPGAHLTARLGAKTGPGFGPPVTAALEVVSLHDGAFVNEGPYERGLAVALGRSAVLRTGAVAIVVTSHRQAVIDPAAFRHLGIDLAGLRLIIAKAKNHFRAAFAARTAAIVEVDAPGPAALDLAALPFRRLPEGIER